MTQIIPANCLKLLDFFREPVLGWTDTCDLQAFLYDLYDTPATAIDRDGNVTVSTYRSHGRTLYERGKQQFKDKAKEFTRVATEHKSCPADGVEIRIERIPDFTTNPDFGLMAKYAIAWSAANEAVLSESAFFSLSHTLESEDEIDCSILLASHLYYKQALQVLRSFIEISILQLFFVTNTKEFSDWQKGQFRTPPLRGRKGLLAKMASAGLLAKALADAADRAYETLNASIHGAEAKLINAGLFSGQWAGLQYKSDQFQDWTSHFSRCAHLGIRILETTVNVWLSTPKPSGIVCDTCHSANNFAVIARDATKAYPTIELKCKACGTRVNYRAAYAAGFGFQ
jgi:hypothetical protein